MNWILFFFHKGRDVISYEKTKREIFLHLTYFIPNVRECETLDDYINARKKDLPDVKGLPAGGLPDGAGVVDGTVDVAGEGERGAEEGDNTVGHIGSRDEGIVRLVAEAEGLEAQVFGIGSIGIEALGVATEGARLVDPEEGRAFLLDDTVEVPVASSDVLAQDLQHLGLVAVVAHSQQVGRGIAVGIGTTRTDMEVVAHVARLLATRADVATHVGFVGALVGAETDVAVDAIGAVLGLEASHGIVERCDAFDESSRERLETLLTAEVFVLMGKEPGAVVVVAQVAKEADNGIHVFN